MGKQVTVKSRESDKQDSTEALRERWSFLYRTRLPALARANHDSQASWPVTLDHCFARIILDNTVGSSPIEGASGSTSIKPWNAVIASPAVRNMSEAQLQDAIALAERIETGRALLSELDEKSLNARGKGSMSSRKGYTAGNKTTESKRSHDDTNGDEAKDTTLSTKKKRMTRKGEMADVWSTFLLDKSQKASGGGAEDIDRDKTSNQAPDDQQEAESLAAVRSKIRAAHYLTPFRREVLLLLTQVPRGRFTTYKALAAAAAARSGGGAPSARAVGGAMRSNPFAPAAPCHRVLAADGRIGGFKGESNAPTAAQADEGAFVREKRAMLRREGVRFDGGGRVVGEPFEDFV